jgi:hypothetical protein
MTVEVDKTKYKHNSKPNNKHSDMQIIRFFIFKIHRIIITNFIMDSRPFENSLLYYFARW